MQGVGGLAWWSPAMLQGLTCHMSIMSVLTNHDPGRTRRDAATTQDFEDSGGTNSEKESMDIMCERTCAPPSECDTVTKRIESGRRPWTED